jgi:hypothetical protein
MLRALSNHHEVIDVDISVGKRGGLIGWQSYGGRGEVWFLRKLM